MNFFKKNIDSKLALLKKKYVGPALPRKYGFTDLGCSTSILRPKLEFNVVCFRPIHKVINQGGTPCRDVVIKHLNMSLIREQSAFDGISFLGKMLFRSSINVGQKQETLGVEYDVRSFYSAWSLYFCWQCSLP
jgi:hypothetical protein